MADIRPLEQRLVEHLDWHKALINFYPVCGLML